MDRLLQQYVGMKGMNLNPHSHPELNYCKSLDEYYRKERKLRLKNVAMALWHAKSQIPAAVREETGESLDEVLSAIFPCILIVMAVVAGTTLIGASAGALAGAITGAGAGAIPGAFAGGRVGFQTGLWILEWLGLAFLAVYVGTNLHEVTWLLERGFDEAWGYGARKDFCMNSHELIYGHNDHVPGPSRVMLSSKYFARAVAVAIRLVLEGIVLYITARGVGKLPELVAQLKNSRLGEGFAVWVENNHQRLLANPKLKRATAAGSANEQPSRVLTDHTTMKKQPRPRTNNVTNAQKLPDGMKNTDNKSIREWYNQQTSPDRLKRLDDQWKKEGIPIEERAERIYNIRHDARLTAREYMQNPEEVAALRSRDLATYGSPDGPTFTQEVQKYQNKGFVGSDVYQAIINGASRTNPSYNSKFGLVR